MKLYFMRHGKAADATLYEDDFERPLTDKGAKRVRRMSQWLARMGVNPAAIYASPRVRAQQTAVILAEALGKSVITREEVNFDFSLAHVQAMVEGFNLDAELVFVGHNPSMSEVVQQITGANLNMEVGSIACAQVMPHAIHQGELAWYLTWSCIKASDD
ncbi:phosphohistidine phosphatase SixA [Aggregatilineales bacterium SYSU G02658]